MPVIGAAMAAAAVVAAALVGRRRGTRDQGAAKPPGQDKRSRILERLEERYRRGEISRETYEELKRKYSKS